MKLLILTTLLIFASFPMFAQEGKDTIKTHELKEVVVQAQMQQTSANVSTYIPTFKQKNTSQTGGELLNRMLIPQLRISDGNSVETVTGKSVDVFIDYNLASDQDMEGMKVSDVKKVEYYDYPTDPRFLGKAHVINVIMQKYEYGGYIKAFGNENFMDNSGSLNGYVKFKYKNLTYDIAGGGFYQNFNNNKTVQIETFRLPQENGAINIFERGSYTKNSKLNKRNYWTTLKTSYQTDKVSINNIIALNCNHTPHNNNSGEIIYSLEKYPSSVFKDNKSCKINSFTYTGYWNFILSSNNSINFNPSYSYSHTSQFSNYMESGFRDYENAAKDNSHQVKADISYTHIFGKGGTLKTSFHNLYIANNTQYFGTSNTKDKAITYRMGPGVTYSLSIGNFYGLCGIGLHWDRSKYGNITETSTAPWVDISLQYSFNNRNSISTEFHYHKSIPSSNYRSASIIQASPFLSYTGNPSLVPYKSYQISGKYTFLPSNKFNLSVYGSSWIVQDRYVYDYVATPTHILRTIQQPMGSYVQGQYGVYGSIRQLEGKLQIGMTISHNIAHNGIPYNWTKSFVSYAIQAFFYAGSFNFGASYISEQGYPDGCMVGTWMRLKDQYNLQIGWSNQSWNVRLYLKNFARWNWNSGISSMKSTYYDQFQRISDTTRHANIQFSATYTFGFGKKIKRGNEATQRTGVNSGILK